MGFDVKSKRFNDINRIWKEMERGDIRMGFDVKK